jgi:hypothetical protein
MIDDYINTDEENQNINTDEENQNINSLNEKPSMRQSMVTILFVFVMRET